MKISLQDQIKGSMYLISPILPESLALSVATLRVFNDPPLQHIGNLRSEPVITQHRTLFRHGTDVCDCGIIDMSSKERGVIASPLQVVRAKATVQVMRLNQRVSSSQRIMPLARPTIFGRMPHPAGADRIKFDLA